LIRVLQFAGCINRFDFIDNIIQYVDSKRFSMGVALGSANCNIEEPVFPPDTPRWVVPWKSRTEVFAAARRLAHILRDWRADILHTHHYDEALIGWLATRLYPRTRLVVGRHYSDAIYRSTTGLKQRAMLMAEQTVNRAAARIIVPSSFIVEILTRRQGVPFSKVDQVPYGFVAAKYAAQGPNTREEVRRELGLEDRFVVGNFARLYKDKGQRYLIQAMALLRSRVPEATLLIAGEGPERATLEGLVQDLGLVNLVRFLGWRRDAIALMSAVDVVVQPTLQEAFSQVMAEALFMARPLIITDVSGAPDIIRHGENGLLVAREDPSALTDAIVRLASDPALRESMARSGRDYVRDHLSIEAVILRYELAYLQAMAMTDKGASPCSNFL
jgi:glycosyltransferase involved in cell wall biosynthesis